MGAQHLLPGNSTQLERDAAVALAQIQRVPIPIRLLWNPDLCPLAVLPYLAWSFSVDRWDSTWSESTKRGDPGRVLPAFAQGHHRGVAPSGRAPGLSDRDY